MFSFIRRLRLAYAVYNFFHKKKLAHNLPVYAKYGISKNYFSSVSSKDFKNITAPTDDTKHDASFFQNSKAFTTLSIEDQHSLQQFYEQGYAILKKFFSTEQIDRANNEIEDLTKTKAISFRFGSKIMFAIKKSAHLKSMGKDKRLLELLTLLLGSEPVLFQSINFLKGSEQHTHSDSIHMTTFPLGKLIAVWVALEDIEMDNGPLHYYPGSHRLPYYLNSDYDNEGNAWLIGDKSYTDYENMIEKKITE